ncbi:hypothetical protein OBK05_12005 [Empedobacter falsenii]
MPKLYIFGIGGTGSRTLKSLAMLLASGVKTNYEIVPIIIDPDKSAADVNRTVKILNDYNNINRVIDKSQNNSFFKNKINTLGNIVNEKQGNVLSDQFVINLEGIEGDKFKTFIDYANLDAENKDLTELLFSNDNLNLDLEVGFKGNPNIGSVVLNSFTKSQTFQYFADSFEEGDRIFIISSIFGGTGAAGFPLLLKNLREGNIGGKFYQQLQDAVIGAITVQPYFKLNTEENSVIDSHTFNSKAKSALHYYYNNITGNKSINALYYIGDNADNLYRNSEGGSTQKNDAHFIELAAALSIIDFANDNNLSSENGIALNPKYKEFGVKNDIGSISFNDLHEKTQNIIKEPLTKFFYFNLFCNDALNNRLGERFAKDGNYKIDSNFLQQSYYSTLSDFFKAFRIWLGELSRNAVAFTPFLISQVTDSKTKEVENIKYDSTNIFNLVNGIDAKKASLFSLSSKNYDFFVEKLNEADKENSANYTSVENKFVELFSEATEKLIKQKLF